MLKGTIPDLPENKRPELVEYIDSLLGQFGYSLERLREQRYETLFSFDAEGNGILKKDGDSSGVDLYGSEGLLIKQRGDTVIHNHPVEDWGFSDSDLLSVVKLNIHRLIAISKKHIYYLTLPDNLRSAEELTAAIFSDTHEVCMRHASWENRGHMLTEKFVSRNPGSRYEIVTL